MGQIDFESRRDEMERDNLLGAIAALETAIAVSSPGTRAILLNSLENAMGRVQVLEKKIKDADAERERRTEEKAAISSLAAEEVKLSQEEKETYSGFLKEDFFSKRDFARLGEFYEHTWDRLSERGKDQMSQRIWAGIRRDEYTFGELPKSVQEKEMGRVYDRVTQPAYSQEASRIPATDRQEFISAYQDGDHARASDILDRKPFRDNMFLGSDSAKVADAKVEIAGRVADRARSGAQDTVKEKAPTDLFGDLNVDALNLGDLASDATRTAVAAKDIVAASSPEKAR